VNLNTLPDLPSKNIRVLFVAAEAEPFIKVGGLGDVAGALPRALKILSQSGEAGVSLDIRLVIPFYPSIKAGAFDLKPDVELTVAHTFGSTTARVFTTQMDGLPVYLIQGDPFLPGRPVYALDTRLDGEKFSFFSLAALELCRKWGWAPDILHANDWHTAPSVYVLSLIRDKEAFFSGTHSVLSLHNLPFMGQGAQEGMQKYGIPPTQDTRLPEWGRDLPLPLGLLTADRIIPVSPTYGREILTPEYGCDLQGFLSGRASAITGILNGLDESVWHPARDPQITARYDLHDLSPKVENKLALQAEFDLAQDASMPLLALVSRMDRQKGVDIALEGLRLLAGQPWQAILLSTGDPTLEEAAVRLASDFPQRVRAAIRFDNRLSHRIYAGADIFMMPSRYEPCGLAQMAAMLYGCIPVASATGGLVDTVVDAPPSQTGFLFRPIDPQAFAQAMEHALHCYQDKPTWHSIQVNGMSRDYSWKQSALQYIHVYQQLNEGTR
jgi:starch synthase